MQSVNQCHSSQSLFCSAHTDQTPPSPSSTSPIPQWEDVDLEEQQLRQKLHEMTDNISDKSLTSDDEEESNKLPYPQEIPAWKSPEREAKPSRLPTRSTSRSSIVVSRLEEEQLQQTESQKVEISLADQCQKVNEKHTYCTSGLLHLIYFKKAWLMKFHATSAEIHYKEIQQS